MKLSFTGTSALTEAIALTQTSPDCTTSSGIVCTVRVSLPTGTYAVSVATYNQAPSGGAFPASAKLLSSASNVPFSVKTGKANTLKLTLEGVPAALSVTSLPSATAGTAFDAPLEFSVTASDAGDNIIVGTYDTPISLSDSDKSGATAIATSGTDNPPAGKLLNSDDVATLSYSGLAISPATIGASATGATPGSAHFAPTLQPIVFTQQGGSNTPAIDLYSDANDPDAAGMTMTFTATESGWTNAPYSRSITATPGSGCSSFSNTSPASGTSFSTTGIASTSGSCTLTLSDGVGQTLPIALSLASSETTISTTGSTQHFTVPAGITRITVTANGAQGGAGYIGLTGAPGGSVTGTIFVTPGQTFDVVIGGEGGNGGSGTAGSAGTNGGGAGAGVDNEGGGGGGGESTVALSGTAFFVAGGGGGSAAYSSDFGGTPGIGGGTSGGNGGAGDSGNGGGGGGGATQSTGGTGGTGLGANTNGGTGTANSGGAAGWSSTTGPTGPGEYAPGGGGAGYFGGGGGGAGVASGDNAGGSGGGGSSWAAGSALSVTYTPGTQSGNGTVIIDY